MSFDLTFVSIALNTIVLAITAVAMIIIMQRDYGGHATSLEVRILLAFVAFAASIGALETWWELNPPTIGSVFLHTTFAAVLLYRVLWPERLRGALR